MDIIRADKVTKATLIPQAEELSDDGMNAFNLINLCLCVACHKHRGLLGFSYAAVEQR